MLIGEGSVVYVLKKLSVAQRDGDQVHAHPYPYLYPYTHPYLSWRPGARRHPRVRLLLRRQGRLTLARTRTRILTRTRTLPSP